MTARHSCVESVRENIRQTLDNAASVFILSHYPTALQGLHGRQFQDLGRIHLTPQILSSVYPLLSRRFNSLF